VKSGFRNSHLLPSSLVIDQTAVSIQSSGQTQLITDVHESLTMHHLLESNQIVSYKVPASFLMAFTTFSGLREGSTILKSGQNWHFATKAQQL
jgi:hypothetical protein